jgi:cell division protease FtsH
MSDERPTGIVARDPAGRSPVHVSPPKDSERTTRKPLGWWDRFKFLILFAAAFFVIVWSTYVQFRPLITWPEAYRRAFSSSLWLIVLFGLELIRQIHFAISEHSAAYHRFWTQHVFGRLDRSAKKMNPWTRYRISRALKVVFFLVLLDIVVAKLTGTSALTALVELPSRLVSALPFAFQLLLYTFLLLFQFGMLFWFLSRGGSDIIFPEDVTTRFADIKGQDAVLTRVKENVIFLENPDLIEEHGGTVPKGILLWGPPGTGKTMMAKAVAGETSKPFISVDPGAFIQMFVGVGILKVKALFRKARKLALRYGGVIMFFDEVDSLGNRGVAVSGGNMTPHRAPEGSPWSHTPACNGLSYVSPQTASRLMLESLQSSGGQPVRPVRNRVIAGMGGFGGGMGTLQALLGEMDGIDKPRGFFNRTVRRALGMRPKSPPKYRILIMMATNIPDVLDEAMLRPGRIDRIYKVGYPSKTGRIDTFRRYLEGKKHLLSEQDIDKLGTITAYYGGAAIEDLVNAALIHAITDGRDAIEWKDIVKAKQIKDLGLPDDVDYIERERHAVAVHEACHAVTAYRVRKRLMIDIATIEKGGTFLGVVTNIPPEELFTTWRSDFEADIMCSVASLAGERMFFDGDSSSGVSGDLNGATRLATLMEGYWGMGSTVASHEVLQDLKVGGGRPGTPGGGGGAPKTEQDVLEGSLGQRIEEKLGELVVKTGALLGENRAEILAVAHALETHKTVTGDDVGAIVDGRPGALIDGRPYHLPEVRDQLEAYHAEAMAAHKSHAAVNMALPVLAPFTPAPVSPENGGGPRPASPNGDPTPGMVGGREGALAPGASVPPRPDGSASAETADAAGPGEAGVDEQAP